MVNAKARIANAMKQFKTVNQLLVVWPDFVNFLDKELLDKVKMNKSRMNVAELKARLPSEEYPNVGTARSALITNDEVTQLLNMGKLAETLGDEEPQEYSIVELNL